MPDELVTFIEAHFSAECAVVAGAPDLFVAAIMAVAVVLYYAVGLFYRHRLGSQSDNIKTLEQRIALRDERDVFQTNRANRNDQETRELQRRVRQLQRESARLKDRVSSLESENK
jgi:hypothetical protein